MIKCHSSAIVITTILLGSFGDPVLIAQVVSVALCVIGSSRRLFVEIMQCDIHTSKLCQYT